MEVVREYRGLRLFKSVLNEIFQRRCVMKRNGFMVEFVRALSFAIGVIFSFAAYADKKPVIPVTTENNTANRVMEAKIHYNFAVQYKNSQNYEEAHLQYEKAISLCDTIYQFHFSHADLLAAMGKPAEAKVELLKTLALNPRHFQTMALLAEKYVQSARYDSALVMYESMYTVEPEHGELLASIAGFREYIGKNDEALAAYSEMIEKGEATYEHLMKAVTLASKNGNPTKARDLAVMALEKKPKDTAALSAAASLSVQIEDSDSAVLYFRQLCELDAADAASCTQLEKLYRTKGETENLIWTLERHLKIAPEDIKVIGEYTELLYARGDIEQSIQYVKKGLTIDPSDGRLHILMGENYRRLNQNDKALAEYKLALKDSSWSSNAQRLIWQIERPESASEKNEKAFFKRGKSQPAK